MNQYVRGAMNYCLLDISYSARADRQQAPQNGRGPFPARARRSLGHILPGPDIRSGGLALRLAFCLCWCAGVLFFAGTAPFADEKIFPGSVRTVEAAEPRARAISGQVPAAANARQPAAGSAAGTNARKGKTPNADPLGTGALTRELTRLLRPERTPARPPEQPAAPPLSSEPVHAPVAPPAQDNDRKGLSGKPAGPETPAPAGTGANSPAAPVTASPPGPGVVLPTVPATAPPKPPEAPKQASPAATTPKQAVVAPPKAPVPPSNGQALPTDAEKSGGGSTPSGQPDAEPAAAERPRNATTTPPPDNEPKKAADAADEETKLPGRKAPPRPAPAEAGDRAKPPGPKQAEGRGVETPEVISRQNIVRVEIKPVNLTVLSAPYDGAIAAILARDGDSVDKDQAVARLDTRAEEQALVAAEALAAETFDRLGTLPESPSREREALAAEYVRQSAQVKAQQARLAQGVITAPFAGTITEVHAKAGEHLRQGSPIVEIAESGSLEIVCSVPSHWVRWLKPGHIVWVYVDETAKSYEAVLVRLGGKVDSASKTIRAYARFSSPQAELLPGMSGSASIRPQMAEEKNEEKAPPEQGRGKSGREGPGSK